MAPLCVARVASSGPTERMASLEQSLVEDALVRPVLVYQQQVASRRPRQDQRIVELGQWLPFTGVERGFIGVRGIGTPLLSRCALPAGYVVAESGASSAARTGRERHHWRFPAR